MSHQKYIVSVLDVRGSDDILILQSKVASFLDCDPDDVLILSGVSEVVVVSCSGEHHHEEPEYTDQNPVRPGPGGPEHDKPNRMHESAPYVLESPTGPSGPRSQSEQTARTDLASGAGELNKPVKDPVHADPETKPIKTHDHSSDKPLRKGKGE